jgi:hypothetical protein
VYHVAIAQLVFQGSRQLGCFRAFLNGWVFFASQLVHGDLAVHGRDLAIDLTYPSGQQRVIPQIAF